MPTTTAAKLQMKPGHRVLIVHPPMGYPDALGPLPEGVQFVTESAPPPDMVLLFAEQRTVLDAALPMLATVLQPHTYFWIAYQKGGTKAGTDLNRDRLWDAMQAYHLAGVTLIALDDRWSAMRFRPAQE